MKRILLIRFSSMGDILLTTPLIRVLRKKLQDSEIFFATKEAWIPLLQHNPNLNGVISLKEDKGGTLELLSQVRQKKFDSIIDLHCSPRSMLISYFSGAKEIFRYPKEHEYRKDMVLHRVMREKVRYVVERYFDSVKSLGITVDPSEDEFRTEIFWKEREEIFASNTIKGKERWIGIIPGAHWRTKRWLPEGFARVSEYFKKKGFHIAIFGSLDEGELLSEIESISEEKFDVRICGASILELASCFKRCSCILTNDSGPMHLSCSVGTPVVAIFGPTVTEFGFFHYGKPNKVVEKDLACRPCSLHGSDVCPEGHFDCMRMIEPKEVISAMEKIL